jgi:hypothetical protein
MAPSQKSIPSLPWQYTLLPTSRYLSLAWGSLSHPSYPIAILSSLCCQSYGLSKRQLRERPKQQLYEVLNLGIPREYGEGKQRQLRVACEIAAHKMIEFDERSSCSTSHNTTIVLSTVIPYV